jgi:hypothetical protein
MDNKPSHIIDIHCPGCGKDIHHFAVPSRPGTYRLQCKGNRDTMVLVTVKEDGSVSGEQVER